MNEQAPCLQPPRPKRRWWRAVLLVLLFCVLAALGGTGAAVYYFLHTPPETPGRDVEVLIPSGYPLARLAEQLEEHKVVLDARAFLLLARYREAGGSVKTGRFLVNTGWTPDRVLDQLTKGRPYLERITLPEGLPWWEVGRRLEAAGYVRYDDFVTLIHDPAFLRHWGIPFDSAEGFLFPDTYLIMRPLELNLDSARSVVGRLIDTFWRKSAAIWPDGRRPGPGGRELVRKIVTLASIVEKETSVASERRRVAGVYENRLRRGMLLQADPTVIYGVGQEFVPPLRRSQLNNADNRYNTYKHPGLPPGPICSPGLACLQAAMNPEEHNYLYFVASGDGSHRFNASLAGHNKDVRAYRRQEKESSAREKAAQRAETRQVETRQVEIQQAGPQQPQVQPAEGGQAAVREEAAPSGAAEPAQPVSEPDVQKPEAQPAATPVQPEDREEKGAAEGQGA
ncbi:MAG TPA: endolytic transglycosylase MltG [Candidatus Avidesulfovibrio excrementigallinarum]|nr:endolytic transglycosylase MltG [Candidatus Avidesulfovibrio excrementigallinarum]